MFIGWKRSLQVFFFSGFPSGQGNIQSYRAHFLDFSFPAKKCSAFCICRHRDKQVFFSGGLKDATGSVDVVQSIIGVTAVYKWAIDDAGKAALANGFAISDGATI